MRTSPTAVGGFSLLSSEPTTTAPALTASIRNDDDINQDAGKSRKVRGGNDQPWSEKSMQIQTEAGIDIVTGQTLLVYVDIAAHAQARSEGYHDVWGRYDPPRCRAMTRMDKDKKKTQNCIKIWNRSDSPE